MGLAFLIGIVGLVFDAHTTNGHRKQAAERKRIADERAAAERKEAERLAPLIAEQQRIAQRGEAAQEIIKNAHAAVGQFDSLSQWIAESSDAAIRAKAHSHLGAYSPFWSEIEEAFGALAKVALPR